jgi:hypothetical protein
MELKNLFVQLLSNEPISRNSRESGGKHIKRTILAFNVRTNKLSSWLGMLPANGMIPNL